MTDPKPNPSRAYLWPPGKSQNPGGVGRVDRETRAKLHATYAKGDPYVLQKILSVISGIWPEESAIPGGEPVPARRSSHKQQIAALRLYLHVSPNFASPMRLEVSGPDGGPIEIDPRQNARSVLAALRQLAATEEETALLEALLERAVDATLRGQPPVLEAAPVAESEEEPDGGSET